MRTYDVSTDRELSVPVEVIQGLHERFQKSGRTLLIIGAAARDLLVHHPARIPIGRATRDVDVAVAVDSWDSFKLATQHWDPVRRSAHTFRVSGVEVDIVPFGGVERDRRVLFPDDHELDVTGLAEAARTAVDVTLPGGTVVPVASLAAQSALKVLAWRDRHLLDRRDAVDLDTILRAASQGLYEDEVWEDAVALEQNSYDVPLAGAWRTGVLAASMFAPEHRGSVREILEEGADALVAHMPSGTNMSYDLVGAYVEGYTSVR